MATTSISDAIAAYANTVRSFGGVATPSDTASQETGTDFASLLKDSAKSAIEVGKKSEQQSMLALAGKADLRDVVSAVNNAELTLQTVVSVRDKIISAYNDILRMTI
jgi:flagellar hook-basal body complex protein FliE